MRNFLGMNGRGGEEKRRKEKETVIKKSEFL